MNMFYLRYKGDACWTCQKSIENLQVSNEVLTFGLYESGKDFEMKSCDFSLILLERVSILRHCCHGNTSCDRFQKWI